MKKNRTRKPAPAKEELSPGEKFLKELKEMPYTYDRVGQISVTTWKGRPFGKKSSEEKTANQELNGNSSNNPT